MSEQTETPMAPAFREETPPPLEQWREDLIDAAHMCDQLALEHTLYAPHRQSDLVSCREMQKRLLELYRELPSLYEARSDLSRVREERDAQLATIQSWRISANLARHHDEALMHLAKRAPSQKGEAHE